MSLVRRVSVVAAAGFALALLPGSSMAFPKFATKEKKPCSFCHVNSSGGGKRTVAGDYYKTHNLSLVGFGAPAPRPAAPKPAPKKPASKPAPKKKK